MTLASGTSSERSSNRLDVNSTNKMLTPVRLPPGLARLATKPSPTGSVPMTNTIGIVEVASFTRERCRGSACRCNQIDFAADEIRSHCRQPVIVSLSPMIFDGQVLTLDVADLS